MDFRQLKYFMMVAEAKSFTRAAEILRLAQPALSNQMQKLEEELQEQLLIRHSRGIELTEAGQRLLVHARTILHQVDIAREEIRGSHLEPKGLVRIGMPRSVCEMIAVPFIREAARRMPGVSIRIVENFSEIIFNMVVERELDIGLTYSTENSSRIRSEIVLPQRLSLMSLASEKFPQADIVEFSDVVNLPLILSSAGHSVRRLVETMAAEAGYGLHVVHEIDSFQTTLNMVGFGLGHTVFPASVVRNAGKTSSIIARTIVNPEFVRQLHIIQPTQSRTQAQSLTHALLVELLQRAE